MWQHFDQNHTRIDDPVAIALVLEKLNQDLHSTGVYFKWDVRDDLGYNTYPDAEIPERSMAVIASFDFMYYHQLELFFYDVAAHSIPDGDMWSDHWVKPQLELLSGDASIHVRSSLGISSDEELLFFAFNIGSHSDTQYYIAAKGISVFMGTVFYYNRSAQEPLKERERNAWWIR